MNTYVAFLRAINVAGQKLIKMPELVRMLTAAGFRNVRTYIQSGNVLFDSTSASPAAVTRKLEATLECALGYKVTVMLRTLPELKALVKRDPFKKSRTFPDEILFVVLLAEDPRNKPKLPLSLDKDSLTVIAVRDRTALVIARPKKSGSFGFPNAFVEKAFGVPATTRKWNTLNKIVQLSTKQC
jgi:uncharacterized protein (DUF1697 family)